MEPLINSNANVSVIPVDQNKITHGSILLIDQGDRFVLHRVLKRYKGGSEFLTAGDNCFCFDKKVDMSYVLGLVAWLDNGLFAIDMTENKCVHFIVALFSYAYIAFRGKHEESKHLIIPAITRTLFYVRVFVLMTSLKFLKFKSTRRHKQTRLDGAL